MALAKELGVAKDTVRKDMKALGLKCHHTCVKDRREQVKVLCKSMTPVQMAERLGVSRPVIYADLKAIRGGSVKPKEPEAPTRQKTTESEKRKSQLWRLAHFGRAA